MRYAGMLRISNKIETQVVCKRPVSTSRTGPHHITAKPVPLIHHSFKSYSCLSSINLNVSHLNNVSNPALLPPNLVNITPIKSPSSIYKHLFINFMSPQIFRLFRECNCKYSSLASLDKLIKVKMNKQWQEWRPQVKINIGR